MNRHLSYAVLSVAAFLSSTAFASAQQLHWPKTKTSPMDAVVGKSVEGIRLDRPIGGGTPQQPPPAASGTVTAISFEDLMALAKKAGLSDVEEGEAKDKSKVVIGSVNGVTVNLFPYECQDNLCQGIALRAFFGKQDDVNAVFLQSYNIQKITKLVKFDSGEVVLMHDLKLYGGVSPDHIQSMSKIFFTSVQEAVEFKPS